MTFSPLKRKVALATDRLDRPRYSVEIKNSQGQLVSCADPSINRALVALMDLGAVNGGAASHWGGPAAMAECMSALYSIMFASKNPWEKYNYVNDIGHAENGIYALKANWGLGGLSLEDLKGFRSMGSKLTGHGESHLYPEGVMLSNGPLSSALPQAQGLALADKLTGNNRLTICTMSDGASMEGEAKEAFASIPGLAKKGKLNPFLLIISDNNTKLSGRISEDSFDMTGTFESMQALGWTTLKVENGNDLSACYHGLENALSKVDASAPVFVWLKTTKGYGVKSTAESKSGGHGFPIKPYSADILPFLDEICAGKTPSEFKTWAESLTVKPQVSSDASSVPTGKAQAGLAEGAIRAAKEGLPVFSVSSDLQGSTGMASFQKAFPDHYVDIGIAESNMVSIAAGLSRQGYIPIVDTFAAFGVTKGNLPLIMASLSSSPMIAVYSHTGFQDAADGASHQSLTYMSAVSSIPNVKAICVSTAKEGEELMYQAIKQMQADTLAGHEVQSYIFFVGRENFPVSLGDELPYKLGRAQVLTEGKDGVVVACGPTLFQALEAQKELAKKGFEITVINQAMVNTPDVATIKAALAKTNGHLVTVEDHQKIGGLGQMLSHALCEAKVNFQLTSLGVKGEFGRSAYSADELYEHYGVDKSAIVKLWT